MDRISACTGCIREDTRTRLSTRRRCTGLAAGVIVLLRSISASRGVSAATMAEGAAVPRDGSRLGGRRIGRGYRMFRGHCRLFTGERSRRRHVFGIGGNPSGWCTTGRRVDKGGRCRQRRSFERLKGSRRTPGHTGTALSCERCSTPCRPNFGSRQELLRRSGRGRGCGP